MRGWNPGARTADQDTIPKLEQARASSRDLFMNTPIAAAALRRITTNAVGQGLTFQSRIDRDFLGLTEEQADVWERTTEREFALWANSKECDRARSLNFREMQRLAMLSVMLNGDAFVVLPFVNVRNAQTPYKLRVQLIEADNVANPYSQADDENTKGGIVFDENETPVAYWVRRRPYKMFAGADDWVKIDAFGRGSGRRNVLHLMIKDRIGQKRGMPLLAPVFEACKQVSRLAEAELMGAVIASMFTVFIRNESGGGGLDQMFTDDESVLHDPTGTSGRDAQNPDDNMMEIGSGNLLELEEGQDVQTASPNRPNSAFDPFFQAIVKQIGAAIEVPYEQLMLSFTSSYSASRAALLEAWKFYKERRAWLADNFCQPVYEEWLTEAIMRGRVSAPGYFDDPAVRQAWRGSYWGGPGQGQIDPVKETKGAQLRVASGLGNFEDEYIAIHGGDWEQNVQRRARQNRILGRERVSVSLDSDVANINARPEDEAQEGAE
jgi:lambda family phage portal protein